MLYLAKFEGLEFYEYQVSWSSAILYLAKFEGLELCEF